MYVCTCFGVRIRITKLSGPNNITIRFSKELAGSCSGLNSTGNKWLYDVTGGEKNG